jgi:hypothetical protein
MLSSWANSYDTPKGTPAKGCYSRTIKTRRDPDGANKYHHCQRLCSRGGTDWCVKGITCYSERRPGLSVASLALQVMEPSQVLVQRNDSPCQGVNASFRCRPHKTWYWLPKFQCKPNHSKTWLEVADLSVGVGVVAVPAVNHVKARASRFGLIARQCHSRAWMANKRWSTPS